MSFGSRKHRRGLIWWLSGKESACQSKRPSFDPWVRKIYCRRKWQPILVFLPEKFHGQRSLAVCSRWGSQRVGHDLATEHIHTFIYLALSSLICGTQELSLHHEVSFIMVCRFQSVWTSVVAVHGFRCSTACGILVPYQGSNPLTVHCKADS